MKRDPRRRLWTATLAALACGGCATVEPAGAPTDVVVQIEPAAEPPQPEAEQVEAVIAPVRVVQPSVKPGTPLVRHGDEIVAAGQFFRTGNPVVLWLDQAGFDGYRVNRRYAPLAEAGWASSKQANPALSSPNRYSQRSASLTTAEKEARRGGNWSLAQLQEVVDQVILHYDVSGTSRQCFERLHDGRGLSIHFMVDVDGTIYQSIDLKEKAWHATFANSRSIGIEIAQIGAYSSPDHPLFAEWYDSEEDGGTRLSIPANAHPDAVRDQTYSHQPMRDGLVRGEINGQELWQYDFTPEQYRALAHLMATLHAVFPKIDLDYPRDENGHLSLHTLPNHEWRAFSGVLGHYHVQSNKIDPGPAFQWERLRNEARELLQADGGPVEALPLPGSD